MPSTKDIPLNDRIILALDVDTVEQAKELVKKTESHIGFYKIGLQLFLASWFELVDWIVDRGHKVMLDLKFYDIPQTVKLAVNQLDKRGISLTTIHGNDPIIRAAVEAQTDVKLLAVTVLTSFGEQDMRAMGMPGTVEELVSYRAGRARELGCDGVVCSGLEAARLRAELGKDFLLVTPGIRPAASAGGDDQTRVMTAGKAIAAGSSHLVVGRPISKAKDPIAVIEAMQQEISEVLET